MDRKKDLEIIQEQKDSIIESMSMYADDSEEYGRLQDRLNKYIEMEEKILSGKRSRGWLDTALKIGTFGVSLAGAILVPNMLANKAYANDAEFKLKNGTIWNLIGRSFGGKKDNNNSI